MQPDRFEQADTLEIRLSGTGGQGLILGGLILAEALVSTGMLVAQSQNYEPVSRGGVSRSDLVASRTGVDFPLLTGLDLLIILDQIAVRVSHGLVRPGGLVLVDADRVPSPPQGDFDLYALPLSAQAQTLQNPRGCNMLALGALAALSRICSQEALAQAIQTRTPSRYVTMNTAAMRDGFRLAYENRTESQA